MLVVNLELARGNALPLGCGWRRLRFIYMVVAVSVVVARPLRFKHYDRPQHLSTMINIWLCVNYWILRRFDFVLV